MEWSCQKELITRLHRKVELDSHNGHFYIYYFRKIYITPLGIYFSNQIKGIRETRRQLPKTKHRRSCPNYYYQNNKRSGILKDHKKVIQP